MVIGGIEIQDSTIALLDEKLSDIKGTSINKKIAAIKILREIYTPDDTYFRRNPKKGSLGLAHAKYIVEVLAQKKLIRL